MKTFKYNEFLKINEEDLSHKPTKVINKYDSILGTDFYNLINNIVTTKNDIDNFIKDIAISILSLFSLKQTERAQIVINMISYIDIGYSSFIFLIKF